MRGQKAVIFLLLVVGRENARSRILIGTSVARRESRNRGYTYRNWQRRSLRAGTFGTLEESAKRALNWSDGPFADKVVENGFFHVRFEDQTEPRVVSFISVKLDQFVYHPSSESGELVLNFGAGAFRLITGDMSSEGIKIVTPSAILGIRGTDLLIRILSGGAIVEILSSGSAVINPLLAAASLVVLEPGGRVAVAKDGSIAEDVPAPSLHGLHGLGSDLAKLAIGGSGTKCWNRYTGVVESLPTKGRRGK